MPQFWIIPARIRAKLSARCVAHAKLRVLVALLRHCGCHFSFIFLYFHCAYHIIKRAVNTLRKTLSRANSMVEDSRRIVEIVKRIKTSGVQHFLYFFLI